MKNRALYLRDLAILSWGLVACAWALAAPGDRDLQFTPDLGPVPGISCFTADSSGRILVAGPFSRFVRRFHPDGSTDLSFAEHWPVTNCLQLAAGPDGGVYVLFSNAGTSRSELVRLLGNGGLDPDFVPRLEQSQEVLRMAVGPDDSVICYASDVPQGTGGRGLIRLKASGVVDPEFLPVAVGGGEVAGLAVEPEDRILLWGSFRQIDEVARFGVARLLRDGSLDLGFNPDEARYRQEPAAWIANAWPLPDGKVLIAGRFDRAGSLARANLARLGGDGSVDPAFDPGLVWADAPEGVQFVAAQQDGKVLAAGREGGAYATGVLRFHPDGAMDMGYALVPRILARLPPVLLPDDSLIMDRETMALYRILGGELPEGPPQIVQQPLDHGGTEGQRVTLGVRVRSVPPANCVWQFNGQNIPGATNFTLVFPSLALQESGIYAAVVWNDFGAVTSRWATLHVRAIPLEGGQVDLTFKPGLGVPLDGTVYAMAAQGDRAILGGQFSAYGLEEAQNIGRIESDGRVDPAFPAGADGPVRALWIEQSGLIYVAGGFRTFSGQSRPGLARLAPNGALDPGYVPELAIGAELRAISPLPDGGILAGGGFPDRGAPLLASLTKEGKLDPDFSLDAHFPAATIWVVNLQSDGGILAGGPLVRNGREEGYLVRLNPDGSVDPGFRPPELQGAVARMLVLEDDSLLVGLSSPTPGTSVELPTTFLRLHPDGAVHPEAPLTLLDPVTAILYVPPGRLLVGTSRDLIHVLIEEGTATPFGAMTDGAVHAIALQRDGRVLIAGDFREVNGVPRPGIARVFGDDGVPPPVLSASFFLGPGFQVSFPTLATLNYVVESSEAPDGGWTELTTVPGDGSWKSLIDFRPYERQRFYRVRAE